MIRRSATAALILAIIAAPVAAVAGGSDAPTPYRVSEHGLTLPDGAVFTDGGHVNIRTRDGRSFGLHFEDRNWSTSDPRRFYIGKSFLPWSAFGVDPDTFCLTWLQWSGANEHYGEGGQPPVGAGCDPKPTSTPTPTPTPSVTPTPTPTPSTTPTPDVTPEPTPEPSATPTPTPEPTGTPEPTPTVSPTPEVTPTPRPTLTHTPTSPVLPMPPVPEPTGDIGTPQYTEAPTTGVRRLAETGDEWAWGAAIFGILATAAGTGLIRRKKTRT